jgi:hypothetical protein
VFVMVCIPYERTGNDDFPFRFFLG